MNIFGFFGSATATMGIPSRLKTGDGRTMKTLGIHHGIQWKTIKDFWRSTKGPTWEFVLRMGNREKPTFGKNFLSEERNAKDHIPNQHGIYQAYIYIYTVYNIYCIYVGICPAEKVFFWQQVLGSFFISHHQSGVKSLGTRVPQKRALFCSPENEWKWQVHPAMWKSWVSGIVRSLHQQCWKITWHYDRITTSKRSSCRHRCRAPPLQTRCTRGTCASFGWREHLRTNLPMAWRRNGHRVTPGLSNSWHWKILFGSVWWEKRCFDGQIIYDCLPYSMEVFLKQLFKIESAKTIVGLNSNHVSHMVVPVEQMTSVICDRHTSGTWVTQARNPWQHERCCTCSSMKGTALNT